MRNYDFIPFQRPKIADEELLKRSREVYTSLAKRRTVREFSPEPIPRETIENCLKAAGTAPNGANRQPWHFVVIEDAEVKKDIREAAEKEEREFYEKRAPKEWLEAIAPLGTDDKKPFLEEAPCLIAIFAQPFSYDNETKLKNYYVTESVGIATGLLITALHESGLSTLTHTPSPMNFLNRLLGRPKEEKAFLLLVVGKPAGETKVPDLSKKPLSEIATFL